MEGSFLWVNYRSNASIENYLNLAQHIASTFRRFLKVSHYLKDLELSIGHWREQEVEAHFLFLTNILVNEALIIREVLMSCKDTTEEYIFVEMKKWEPHDTHLRLLLLAGCFPAIVSGPYDSRWDVHESTNGLSALVTT